MAYDGFYAGLSDRATVSEILNQAIVVKDQVVAVGIAVDADATDAAASASQSAASASQANNSASAVASDRAAVEAALAASNRQFSIYAWAPAATSGVTVLTISPQYSLEYVAPPADWISNAIGTGKLELRVVNNGVVMSTPVHWNVVSNVVNLDIIAHTFFRGDTLQIVCTEGSLTNISLTLRYKSGEV